MESRDIRPTGRLEITPAISKSLHRQGKDMSTHDLMYGESQIVLTSTGSLIAEYGNGFAENAGKADPKNPEHVAAVERAGGNLKPDGKFANEHELRDMREAQKQAAIDKHQAGEKAVVEKHQAAEKAAAALHRSAEQRAAEGRQLLEKASAEQRQQPAQQQQQATLVRVPLSARSELKNDLRNAERTYYSELTRTTSTAENSESKLMSKQERVESQIEAKREYEQARVKAYENFFQKAYGTKHEPKHATPIGRLEGKEGAQTDTKPRDIAPDWKAKAHDNRTEYFHKTAAKPAIIDTGKSVQIHDHSPEAHRAALLLANDKFGDKGFKLNFKNPENLNIALHEAGKLGILDKVKGPPEVVDRIQEMKKEAWQKSPEYAQMREAAQARRAAEIAQKDWQREGHVPGADADKAREKAGIDNATRETLKRNDITHELVKSGVLKEREPVQQERPYSPPRERGQQPHAWAAGNGNGNSAATERDKAEKSHAEKGGSNPDMHMAGTRDMAQKDHGYSDLTPPHLKDDNSRSNDYGR